MNTKTLSKTLLTIMLSFSLQACATSGEMPKIAGQKYEDASMITIIGDGIQLPKHVEPNDLSGLTIDK